MLKSLTLISLLLCACSFQITNIPLVKYEYTGNVILLDEIKDFGERHRYVVGLKLDTGHTKYFECSEFPEEKNYEELKRIHKLHKMGDIVTITWHVREKKTKEKKDAE